MAAQQSFMAVGQSYYRNQPFNLADLHQAASTSTSNVGMSSGPTNPAIPQSTFRAPAHRHAHHLHSIPPREKSTRTLIIDHMLWVHGRTRFSQARAELGMTDRTGGPSSLNYVHRTRPEGFEEEDEEDSEGEEVIALKARTGDPNHPMNTEDDRFRRQDLALARTLRLRAEGVEKVITSMLDQPPPIHPLSDGEPSANNHSNLKDLHRLPNGVRLRLALGTIVNDLFARQPFHPPYRHTHPPQSHKTTLVSQEYSPSDLPEVLRPLAPISGAFAPHVQHQPSPSPMALHSPAYSDYTTQYSQPSPNQVGSAQNPFQTFHTSLTERNSLPRPNLRTRGLYFPGSDPSTANCPPALRCPRHLQNGCEICTEERSPSRPTPAIPRARSGHRASLSSSWKTASSIGVGGGSPPGLSGWQEGTGIGSGLLRPAVRGSALRRTVIENDMTAGAGNTKLSKLIPRFLRLSALVAAELGREARGEEVDSSSEDGRVNGSGGDNEVGGMVTSTPHGGGGNSPTPSGNVGTPGRNSWSGGNNAGGGGGYASVPSSPTMKRAAQSPTESHARERARMYEKALRPSREWYMLLAGLLTRAVLEGYLTAGWSGLQAVQCLLLIGLGINENLGYKDTDEEEDDEAQFASLDPDELPDLMQAIKILFPSSRTRSFGVKDQAEEEYEMEMLERLRTFYDIPLSTPDCSIHMEGLACQYPAENVERAAVRYCEAIARWRGKPELETYKKKPQSRTTMMTGDLGITTPGGTSPMTIESLVHSNPTSPNHPNGGSGGGRKLRKPSIDVYFPRGQGGSSPLVSTSTLRGQSGTCASGVGAGWIPILRDKNKRYREVDDVGRVDESKRMYAALNLAND